MRLYNTGKYFTEVNIGKYIYEHLGSFKFDWFFDIYIRLNW